MNSVCHELIHQIRELSDELKTRASFFVKLDRHALTREDYARFLKNAYALVSLTPVHLQLAVKSSLALGDHELAEFFKQKIEEEKGHNEWAQEDLGKIHDGIDNHDAAVVPAMRSFIRQIEALISADPLAYVGYILLAEYFTVLNTEWIASRLAQCPELREASITIFTNHADLDREHVKHDMELIEAMAAKRQGADSLRRGLALGCEFYRGAYEQFATRTQAGQALHV